MVIFSETRRNHELHFGQHHLYVSKQRAQRGDVHKWHDDHERANRVQRRNSFGNLRLNIISQTGIRCVLSIIIIMQGYLLPYIMWIWFCGVLVVGISMLRHWKIRDGRIQQACMFEWWMVWTTSGLFWAKPGKRLCTYVITVYY